MRSAYGAKEIRIGGHLETIIVDVANVMGSRPDGWWRDRAGAAVRLHDQIVRLAASGRAILPADARTVVDARTPRDARTPCDARIPPRDPRTPRDARIPGGVRTPGGIRSQDDVRSPGDTVRPGFVLVLEGAANAAATRLPPAPSGVRAPSPVRPGEVRVVQARGSGDDAIVAVVRELPGRRVVVTADRELRARCVAAGAEILGPGWLLGLLRD
jgi:8-oxo-dGTP diphosphatase